jgi:hypothetical protein
VLPEKTQPSGTGCVTVRPLFSQVYYPVVVLPLVCMHNRRHHSFVCLLSYLLVVRLLAASASSGQDSHYCTPAQLDSRGLVQHPCSWGREPIGPVFPTDNAARSITGRELHELLSVNTEHAVSDGNSSSSSSSRKDGLVVLFYLAGDPPSV